MKVKIVFGSDIRRWHVPRENQFEELVNFVQDTFNFPDAGEFFLQFEDDEGDRMTISSSNELNDAFVVAEQEGRKSLKIFLVPVSIREAHSEALSQFGSSRSVVSSLDRFEVVSNAPSRADSSFSSMIEAPEPNKTQDAGVEVEFVEESMEDAAVEETGPRPWKEELGDFLANEAIADKLGEYVKAIMQALRAQDEPDLKAALGEASRQEFGVIEDHPLMVYYVFPHVEHLTQHLQCLLPVLLAFDDDHVAKIVPQLIEAGEQLFSGATDAELDVTPIFGMLFPEWMAHMTSQNPEGAVVDLSHIFGCGDAFEAAAAMMAGSECKEEEVTHARIICDMCNATPIVGARFKCTVCPDFDMCGMCEATNTHNRDHPLLKLNRPRRGLNRGEMHGLREMFQRGRCGGFRRCWRGANGYRAKASFVADVNVPDRSYYLPGVVLEKVWQMKNTGAVEWGPNVTLVFVKGCRSMTIEDRYPVPNAQPGQVVEVKAMIRTPESPSHYCSYYRLEKDGQRFGPKIWVDLFVTEDENEVGDSDLSVKEVRQLRRQEKLAEKKAEIESKIDALQKEIDDAQEVEGMLSCMCGRVMERVDHKVAYGRGARIHCDSCGHLCRGNEEIYHCPDEFSSVHPEGFDMCDGCAHDQLRIAREMEEEAGMSDAVEQEFATEVNEMAPPAIEESEFAYQDGLDQILQMGFGAEERVRALLVANEGNVDQVVHQLLDEM